MFYAANGELWMMSVKPCLEVQTCKEVHPSLLIKCRVAGVASSSQGWDTETGHLESPIHLKWGPGIEPWTMCSCVTHDTTIPPHEEVQSAKIRGNSCAGDASSWCVLVSQSTFQDCNMSSGLLRSSMTASNCSPTRDHWVSTFFSFHFSFNTPSFYPSRHKGL